MRIKLLDEILDLEKVGLRDADFVIFGFVGLLGEIFFEFVVGEGLV